MTPEEFRAFGHRVVDWIADYRRDVGDFPVMARTAPGEIKAALPAEPPVHPESFDDILRDLDRVIVPGLSHWQHPSFFGYFPSNGALASVLGDFLSTGLGVLGLSWQSSPALTELEEVATDWLRQMVGLSDAWSGVIQDTASTSTLVALLTARERASDYSMHGGGLKDVDRPLVVYASAHAHSSVEKAALLAGFGRDNLRLVPHDDAFAMRADALAGLIDGDARAGCRPCAIVATTGTTSTTALDPVREIVSVAQRHGLWVHVDAAMAGTAMILPECRWMWDGIEGADSIVVNAHKWLGAAFDCSVYYVRDPEALVRVMSTSPSYLRSTADTQVRNLRDWGLPLGRRFRALKLWCLIREQGVEALQTRVRRDLENARWLAGQVRATPPWRLVAPVQLQTVCVRHEPLGLEGDALDRHTLAWADRLNRSGKAYVTPAVIKGGWMVRISVGAITTEGEHVERLWLDMREAAESA
ncbi:MAG: pyridoxal-dependent decarboxylase [Gemmatimonadota bacterium]|nr:pyridoxal-dependent decarboxylase [Gemmatimonadota bacterium]